MNVTEQDDLYFVGHSQGTTVYFIMISELPEYNKKIRLSVMLAPVTYTSHIYNPLGRILGDFIDIDRVSIQEKQMVKVTPIGTNNEFFVIILLLLIYDSANSGIKAEFLHKSRNTVL